MILPVCVRAADDPTFFNEEVLPILKAKCYKCHSHEADKMKGGLALDSRSGWEKGGDSGPAVVPGQPSESILLEAISHLDADLKMPPKKKLAEAEIATLTEWVRLGAPDPRNAPPKKDFTALAESWWSLAPLKQPPLPAHKSADSNPIDLFIRHRLSVDKLSPAPRADRRTLIRRLSLNLHGLPPTPEQSASFAADSDPQAYRKLVDRLLASPRYGERWARHWLDTIHFADSHGCEHDVQRPNAWPFRDYVINRLNEDVSWDRFIREQLAPDVFYPEESHLLAGLGFVAAGPLELSRASTAPVTFDYLDRDDIVTQTMSAFVSTTANCARCHDHKFDPITQEDYYSLQAVFAGVGKGDLEFHFDPRTKARRAELTALKKAAAAKGESILDSKFADIIAEWERRHTGSPATWHTFHPESFQSSSGTTLRRLEDQSYLATGSPPETDIYTITGATTLTTLTGIRLDVLPHESLPAKGPGRAVNGNLHLSEFEVFLTAPGASEPSKLKVKRASADWNQQDWNIAHALDGKQETAWGIHPKEGEAHHAVFELQDVASVQAASRLTVVLKQVHGRSHLLGRVKISLTDAPGANADILPDHLRAALALHPKERSKDQQLAIAGRALEVHAERELDQLPGPTTVYAVTPAWSHGKKLDTPLSKPKTVHVLHRGDIKKPGKEAVSGSISAIRALPGRFAISDQDHEANRRAALADWIAHKDNPLTWRSVVNRVWHYHFGRGLCDTPNDLGRMGGTPSHPELLEWLAVWFRDEAKGSLKELHRLILNSQTYQQSSLVPNEDAATIDSNNRLLWRMNRSRLDAESYRDSLLQISGRIDLTMGGPAIELFNKHKGIQSTPKLDYQAYDWSQPAAARRSIYRVVWRGIADPFMEALDFPDMALLAPKRGNSVSALQSLTLYNNSFVLHHSDQLAAHLSAKSTSLEEQVRRAVQLTCLRDPTNSELRNLTEFAQSHGLASLARVLFNSNEFLFID